MNNNYLTPTQKIEQVAFCYSLGYFWGLTYFEYFFCGDGGA